MNWTRVAGAGLAAGIVGWLADFVMHGLILGNTYKKYPQVFTQSEDPSGAVWFLLIAVVTFFFAAILFAKTRQNWADGFKGGATYGFFLGLVGFWTSFYSPLVIDGFPYYLAWCQGGAALITCVLGGAVLGAVIKRA